MHVRSPVGLKVKTHNLHRPNSLNAFWQQVDLCANSGLGFEMPLRAAGFSLSLRARACNFSIDRRFDDRLPNLFARRSNSKSILPLSGSISPPVTERAIVAEDDPHNTCIAVCVRISL